MNLWHVGHQPEAELGNNIYLYLHTIIHVCPNHGLSLIRSISKHLQFSQPISVGFAWPDLVERNVRQ